MKINVQKNLGIEIILNLEIKAVTVSVTIDFEIKMTRFASFLCK